MKNIKTKEKVIFGRRISNSNCKTKRKFLINKSNYYFKSEILKNKYRIRTSKNCVKTLKIYGGLDTYLIKTSNKKLNDKMTKIKKKIIQKIKNIH